MTLKERVDPMRSDRGRAAANRMANPRGSPAYKRYVMSLSQNCSNSPGDACSSAERAIASVLRNRAPYQKFEKIDAHCTRRIDILMRGHNAGDASPSKTEVLMNVKDNILTAREVAEELRCSK